MSRKWRATHRIRFESDDAKPFVSDVMLLDGVGFTREEWVACSTADWEVVDGRWLFQGQPTPGGQPGMVTAQRAPARYPLED